jgi:hypothetical protein
VVDERVEEDMSLCIFGIITNTSEPTEESVNRKFLVFYYYQMDVKKSNVHCSGGKNMRTCFL